MGYKDRAKQNEYQRNYVAENRRRFFAGKSCALCGARRHLQVHHRDPAEKTSHRVWSWSEARRLEELAKCVVWCKDCHSDWHAEQRLASCGTNSAYKRGCRCTECRGAHAAVARGEKWRQRHCA